MNDNINKMIELAKHSRDSFYQCLMVKYQTQDTEFTLMERINEHDDTIREQLEISVMDLERGLALWKGM